MGKNEVVKASDNQLAIIEIGETAITEVLAENCGSGFSIFDLPSVKVPAAGGTAWEVPALDGSEHVKELSGVILHMQDQRTYWMHSMDEGGSGSPDCTSRDAVHGVALTEDGPGGTAEQPRLCATCPMAEFGSGKGGSQGCSLKTQILLLQEEQFLPVVVTIPPTSLKAKRKYMLQLTSARKSACDVVTTLRLTQTTNKAGTKYSVVEFGCSRILDEAESQVVRRYRAQLMSGTAQAAPTQEPDEL